MVGLDEGWEDARAVLNGEPLEIVRRRVGQKLRTVAEWPRSNPGNFRLRVTAGELDVRETVGVDPRKISRPQFDRLLEDLESRLPTSIAIRLQQCGALSGLDTIPYQENSLKEELARLRRAVLGTDARPGLSQVLRSLASGHHRVLRTHEPWLRREHARRPAPARLMEAFRRESNIERDDSFPRGLLPVRVADARVEHTADTYENRLLVTYSREVTGRLRRLERIISADRRPALAAEIGALSKRHLSARRYATFLDEVGPLKEPPIRMTMVLLQRPEYRAALAGYRELRQSVRIVHQDDRLETHLRDLPTLYQLWGTLVVIDALLAFAEERGLLVENQRLVRPRRRTGFLRVLPDGKEALHLSSPSSGAQIRVFPERSFRKSDYPYGSLTYTQRPDIVIEVLHPARNPRLLILDPKYKLWSEEMGSGDGRPQKQDLDKMHAYRDSIRDRSGGRVVRYAAIMYPGSTVTFRDRLGAFHTVPGSEARLTPLVKMLVEAALDDPDPGRVGPEMT